MDVVCSEGKENAIIKVFEYSNSIARFQGLYITGRRPADVNFVQWLNHQPKYLGQ